MIVAMIVLFVIFILIYLYGAATIYGLSRLLSLGGSETVGFSLVLLVGVTAVAVIAMIAAILLITWARFEVHGTSDIQAALIEDGPIVPQADEQRELDAAVTSNRFAAGVSPQ